MGRRLREVRTEFYNQHHPSIHPCPLAADRATCNRLSRGDSSDVRTRGPTADPRIVPVMFLGTELIAPAGRPTQRACRGLQVARRMVHCSHSFPTNLMTRCGSKCQDPRPLGLSLQFDFRKRSVHSAASRARRLRRRRDGNPPVMFVGYGLG